MKLILEIKVVEDDNVFLAFSEKPDIMAQARSISEAIDAYAMLYELEQNSDFPLTEQTEV